MPGCQKIANDGLTRHFTVVTDLSPEVNQSVNLNIRIPQGSVATRLRRGGEYGRGLVARLLLSLPIK